MRIEVSRRLGCAARRFASKGFRILIIAERQSAMSLIVVIDDNLSRSGGGVVRPGFERLLLAICAGRVGIVLVVEASRLGRNGRDWHTLLEFCGPVGCLLADEDQAVCLTASKLRFRRSPRSCRRTPS